MCSWIINQGLPWCCLLMGRQTPYQNATIVPTPVLSYKIFITMYMYNIKRLSHNSCFKCYSYVFQLQQRCKNSISLSALKGVKMQNSLSQPLVHCHSRLLCMSMELATTQLLCAVTHSALSPTLMSHSYPGSMCPSPLGKSLECSWLNPLLTWSVSVFSVCVWVSPHIWLLHTTNNYGTFLASYSIMLLVVWGRIVPIVL